MLSEIILGIALILLGVIAFGVGVYFIRTGISICKGAGDAFSITTDRTIGLFVAIAGVAIDLIVIGAGMGILGL